ncbi:MAG TPA: phosphoglycerate dehydrogenase [bacterium]|nr:phosphoglycerate dehydrogenase [bacterium]HOL46655.1 phosphoglycerate dehydrogenase [bacterium]HPQ17774.1 phosphoglycerate dehydrogenase [bacterium]
MKKKKVLITSYPFCVINKEPLKKLKKYFEVINPAEKKKEKLTKEEIKQHIKNVWGIIAGTEKYDKEIFDEAKELKIISRLGIGLDNIDFKETKKRGITVCYTPEAQKQAVAELTLGFIINSIRKINIADYYIKKKEWQRIIGKDLENLKVGIIGLGRIGKIVAMFLKNLKCEVYANDIKPDFEFAKENKITLCSKKKIYKIADVITLHIPLSKLTENLITKKELLMMKKDGVLINTARGKIVNEKDLYEHLKKNKNFTACLDVFENEPYYGNLIELPNVILTAHMGSCSVKSRYLMEMGAVNNLIEFLKNGNPILAPI